MCGVDGYMMYKGLLNKVIDFFNQHHYEARFTCKAGAGLPERTCGGQGQNSEL